MQRGYIVSEKGADKKCCGRFFFFLPRYVVLKTTKWLGVVGIGKGDKICVLISNTNCLTPTYVATTQG